MEKTGCLVHQRADFTVSAKDAGRGPLKITAQVCQLPLTFLPCLPCGCHGNACLSVPSQDAEGKPVEVKVTSKGDGLYACSYTPASPIKHTLAITWGGVSIPKSPFRVSSPSQPLLSAGGSGLPGALPRAPGGPAEPEFLFKAERIEILQADSPKSVQPRAEDVGVKPKKPLIIIVTYTEETYSC